MPFYIRRSDKSVQKAVRRIADEQIGRALRDIEDTALPVDKRIHMARKRCKKLRGLLRLVRPGLDGFARENAAFRDAARSMSGLRDRDALIDTYDALMLHRGGQIDRGEYASIRARLTRDAKAAHRDDDSADRIASFRTAMTRARHRAAVWSLDDAGFDAVAGGVRKTYERARHDLQAAWADPSDTAMHDWRKRIKNHWYQVRLLQGINPPMMLPRAARLSELADLLGDHHDLVVLDRRIAADPDGFGPKTDLDAFRAHLARRKEALAGAAFDLGRVLLAEEGKPLVKRWGGYWSRWRAGRSGPDALLLGG